MAATSLQTNEPVTRGRGAEWPDATVDMLRKLHSERKTATQIASEIGGGLTRSAVLGKIHRLGLSAEVRKPLPAIAKVKAQAPPPKPRSAPMPPQRPEAPKPLRTLEALVEPVPATTEADAAPHGAITIHELRNTRCHWPFGDPRDDGFRYCGAPVPPDRREWEPRYCAGHRAIAYTPAKGKGR